jgi:hypothetical protein
MRWREGIIPRAEWGICLAIEGETGADVRFQRSVCSAPWIGILSRKKSKC